MIWKLALLSASTLGYVLFLTLRCGQRALVAPFLTICLIVVGLYGFALVGQLALGVQCVVGAGIVSGIYAVITGKEAFASRFSIKKTGLYLIFLVPFVLVFQAIANDFMFLVWDELSFWARSQRLIFDSNALIQAQSPISFKNYPPGQQLFQYYVTVMAGWSEKKILFAQDVFILSGVLAAVATVVKKEGPALLTFIAALTLIYFFRADYVTIYSDSLVAIFFAVGLALAANESEQAQDNLSLLLVLSAFVLIKEVAVIFTVIVLTVYVLKRFMSHEQPLQSYWSRTKTTGLAIVMMALPIVFVWLSWSWYVSTLAIEPNGMPALSISSYGQEALRPRLDKTVAKFLEALKQPGYFESRPATFGFKLSLIQLFAWLAALGCLLIILSPQGQRRKASLILLTIAAGAVAYHAFLLWTYLVYFTEYEGVRLASFERYSWTYMLAWALLVVCLLGRGRPQTNGPKQWLAPALLVTVALYLVPGKFYADLKGIQSEPNALAQKKKAIALAGQVKKHIKPGEKVYFIAQNTNGYEKHMFDYAMIPFLPNNCWSVGAKYSEADVWSCNQPLEQLINGYDYLAIYNADQRFWNDNARLFLTTGQNSQQGVYKIISREGRVVALEPVN
jgi:hypothetical protein